MSETRPEHRAGFLPEIESVRGLCAFAVAFGHATSAIVYAERHPHGVDWFVRTFISMPLLRVFDPRAAVIVFFVISGLVLSLALDRIPAERNPREFARYFWRRCFRLYPAHATALIVFLPIVYFTIFRLPIIEPDRLAAAKSAWEPWIDGFVYGHFNRLEAVRTAVLYDNFYNPVTWTLQVEIIGSLFIPFFAALSRAGRAEIDLGVLALLLAATWFVDPSVRPDHFILYLPAFYLGCMTRTHGRRLAAWFSARARWSVLAVAGAFIAPSTVTTEETPARYAAGIIVLAALCAFVLLSIIAWTSASRLKRVLLHPGLRWLGRNSYSFYLWHSLITIAFMRTVLTQFRPEAQTGWTLWWPITVVTTIGLALIVAEISYRLIERPFIRLGNHLLTHAGAFWRGTEAAPAAGIVPD